MSQTRVGLAFQHDARHQARVGQAGKPALQDGFTNTFSTPAPPFRNAFHAATRFGLASYARGGIARLDGIGTSVPVMACTPSLDRRPCRHDCRVLPPAAAVPPARSAGVRPVAPDGLAFRHVPAGLPVCRQAGDERFQAKYGYWRPIIERSVTVTGRDVEQ